MLQSQYSVKGVNKSLRRLYRDKTLDPKLCVELTKKYRYSDLRDKPLVELTEEEFWATLCFNLYYTMVKPLYGGFFY
jgi:hypothetical protein